MTRDRLSHDFCTLDSLELQEPPRFPAAEFEYRIMFKKLKNFSQNRGHSFLGLSCSFFTFFKSWIISRFSLCFIFSGLSAMSASFKNSSTSGCLAIFSSAFSLGVFSAIILSSSTSVDFTSYLTLGFGFSSTYLRASSNKTENNEFTTSLCSLQTEGANKSMSLQFWRMSEDKPNTF